MPNVKISKNANITFNSGYDYKPLCTVMTDYGGSYSG